MKKIITVVVIIAIIIITGFIIYDRESKLKTMKIEMGIIQAEKSEIELIREDYDRANNLISDTKSLITRFEAEIARTNKTLARAQKNKECLAKKLVNTLLKCNNSATGTVAEGL